MSINKFNPNNYVRQYKSLSINTKSLTTSKFENFSDIFPVLSSFNFSGDFGDIGIDTESRATFYDNFVKVSISFTGVAITSNTGSGTIEFKIEGNALKNISPTVNTDYVFGQGSFVINLEQWTYNLSNTETFFDGVAWKMRCTFTPNGTITSTSSPNNFGNITLFYNI